MLMKIDKRNKRVLIMPPCEDNSPADKERAREMLEFFKAKFKKSGFEVIQAPF